MDIAPFLETSDRGELRLWLRKNHRTARQVWVATLLKMDAKFPLDLEFAPSGRMPP